MQGFFAHVLQKNCFGDYAVEKGRFRSFLMLMLKRFMANEWHRGNRQKRGGGKQVLSIDAPDTEEKCLHEPVDEASPERDFERQWVINLGLTAVSLFGIVIAIFIGIGLVSKEIEKRTLYTVLSRPVRRWEFIVGKFFHLRCYIGICW